MLAGPGREGGCAKTMQTCLFLNDFLRLGRSVPCRLLICFRFRTMLALPTACCSPITAVAATATVDSRPRSLRDCAACVQVQKQGRVSVSEL